MLSERAHMYVIAPVIWKGPILQMNTPELMKKENTMSKGIT